MNESTDTEAALRWADLCIAAAAEAWRGDGEVLASGIGVIPRLAASLAKLTHSPELLMTDGEAFLVSEPVPLGPRNGYRPKIEGWMPYGKVFDLLWGGRRHAMIGPTQVDRFGQTNISCIGDDYRRPKVQLLGARGLPGNSVNHANSMFVPDHNRRVFVAGEVDMAAGAGYHPARFPDGVAKGVDLRVIVTNLCVLDFAGPERAIRLRSLHPGVDIARVIDNTGFEIAMDERSERSATPNDAQRDIIARLDPGGLRTAAVSLP